MTPERKQHYDYLATARSHAKGKNYRFFELYVTRAYTIKILSDYQWFNLQQVAGSDRTNALRMKLQGMEVL